MLITCQCQIGNIFILFTHAVHRMQHACKWTSKRFETCFCFCCSCSCRYCSFLNGMRLLLSETGRTQLFLGRNSVRESAIIIVIIWSGRWDLFSQIQRYHSPSQCWHLFRQRKRHYLFARFWSIARFWLRIDWRLAWRLAQQ